ncbi:arginine-tRNA-protein transferase [Absidia repens]|uniref:Arginyl-tRNA--protein transferase 1 n=1 Tax=Absidia repens TaxID=90262 RepID=A0A1X2IG00_9FUNG|nr:arginine-tRNA-protein transferase [Absidia repens]
MSTKQQLSIVSIVGNNTSDCGYCNQDDTSYTFGIWAHALSCTDYQALIDRGWRRSGKYVYKPDLRRSCCPQYTIRLDATEFKTTKSQRKILHKFNRYIHGDWQPSQERPGDQVMKDGKTDSKKPPHKKEPAKETTLLETIHAGEQEKSKAEEPSGHSFKVVLEPSSFTKEKYEIYRKYQQEIHHDPPHKITAEGFKRFLVDSPLDQESHGDVEYGSYHQKYILDGTLVAVAILDILPHCVSSVYFMYDPHYAFLGLGNYSALREISLVQEFHTSSEDLKYYYMGYYIHSCEKMKYKAKYHPSDLLDPDTYDWYSYNDVCKSRLDQHKYTSFANNSPDKSSSSSSSASATETHTKDQSSTLPSGWMDPKSIDEQNDLDQVLIIAGKSQVVPVTMLVKFHESSEFRDEIKDYVASLGLDLAHRLIIA